MSQLKVIITDLDLESIEIEQNLLSTINATLERHQCRTEEDVIAIAADADVLFVQWAPISERVIRELKNCRLICRYGIGIDMIDIPAATKQGIAVCNVPDYALEEVANQACAMLLTLNQRLFHVVSNAKSGNWNTGCFGQNVFRLTEATLGLFGYGRIARLVAQRMAGFGMRILVHDPFVEAEAIQDHPVELVSFDDLIEQSDFLSLHAPLVDSTRHLFNASVFSRMKNTAYLVNTARGALIATGDLVSAIQNKEIAGAALDVFEEEPLPPAHPLFQLENVVITPHVSWYSLSALPTIQNNIAQEVIRFIKNESLNALINPDYQNYV